MSHPSDNCDSESFTGTVKHKTDAAILISFGDEEHWIPLSLLVTDDDDPTVGDTIDFEVPSWFARKEGLL